MNKGEIGNATTNHNSNKVLLWETGRAFPKIWTATILLSVVTCMFYDMGHNLVWTTNAEQKEWMRCITIIYNAWLFPILFQQEKTSPESQLPCHRGLFVLISKSVLANSIRHSRPWIHFSTKDRLTITSWWSYSSCKACQAGQGNNRRGGKPSRQGSILHSVL